MSELSAANIMIFEEEARKLLTSEHGDDEYFVNRLIGFSERFEIALSKDEAGEIIKRVFDAGVDGVNTGLIVNSNYISFKDNHKNLELRTFRTKKNKHETQVFVNEHHITSLSTGADNHIGSLKKSQREELLSAFRKESVSKQDAENFIHEGGKSLNDYLSDGKIIPCLNGHEPTKIVDVQQLLEAELNGDTVRVLQRAIGGVIDNGELTYESIPVKAGWFFISFTSDGERDITPWIYPEPDPEDKSADLTPYVELEGYGRFTFRHAPERLVNFEYTNGISVHLSAKGAKAFSEGVEVNIDEIHQICIEILKQHVHLETDAEYNVASLWVLATYFTDVFRFAPYLWANALYGSGKSEFLQALSILSFMGQLFGVPRVAPIARSMDIWSCTQFLDEFDIRWGKNASSDQEEISQIVKLGSKRGANYIRCEGDNMRPVQRNPFGFRAFSSILELDPAMRDRCIIFIMRKRKEFDPKLTPQQTIEDFIDCCHILRLTKSAQIAAITNALYGGSVVSVVSNNNVVSVVSEREKVSDEKKTHTFFSDTHPPEQNNYTNYTPDLSLFTKWREAIPRGSGRLRNCFTPLICVLSLFEDEDNRNRIMEDVISFSREQLRLREGGTISLPRALRVISEILSHEPPEDHRFTPKTIAGWMNKGVEEGKKKIGERAVGNEFQKLKLGEHSKRHSFGMVYTISPEMFVQLAADHDLPLPYDTHHDYVKAAVELGLYTYEELGIDPQQTLEDKEDENQAPSVDDFENVPEDEIVKHLLETRKAWGKELPKLEEWVQSTKCRPALDDVPVDRVRGIATRLLDAETHTGGPSR